MPPMLCPTRASRAAQWRRKDHSVSSTSDEMRCMSRYSGNGEWP